MHPDNCCITINEIMERVRSQKQGRFPTASSSAQLEQALRARRKIYLGSHIHLRSLLETDGVVEDEAIDVLAGYLSQKALLYWNHKSADAQNFSYRFFRITIFALLRGEIRECVDDIIQMCSAMIRSRDVYRIVEQDLLPVEMFGELFEFLEESDDAFFSPDFEDSVLFAIATLLRTLREPSASREDDESEDEEE